MNIKKRTYKAVGLMSGTSLDGLDIVRVDFNCASGSGSTGHGSWSYEIVQAVTIPYSDDWRRILSHSHLLPKRELVQLDRLYGEWIGEQVKEFIGEEQVDVIGSHGHTVHHLPPANGEPAIGHEPWAMGPDSANANAKAWHGRSVQIGSGQAIAYATGTPVIYDFRQPDLDLGGQGAPLVPIGDKLLFGEYAACLNLGGFMNASWEKNGVRKAGDIGPMNIALNKVAQTVRHEYDPEGQFARKGKVIPELFKKWNALPFFKQPPPKSLGREFTDAHYFPEFEGRDPYDLLATLTHHAAKQLALNHGLWTMNFGPRTMNEGASKVHGSWSEKVHGSRSEVVLATGGGAYNTYFRELVTHYGGHELTLPDPQLINYKEALIFAFMAVLKQRGEVNVLSSVTGSARDHASGREAHPQKH